MLPPGRKKLLKAVFFGCLLFVLIAAWLGFGERGFIHLYRMDRERQVCLDRIVDLETENRKMLREIERLRTDTEYIEYVARKDLGLVRENEVIYRFAREGEETEPPAHPESGEDARPTPETTDRMGRK